jgi:hypothetical protein
MVFGIGIDGQAHSARFDTNGDQVNGWVLVAPGQFRSLAAGEFGAGQPELFGIGPDNRVYGARFDPNGNLINGWFVVAPGAFRSVSVGRHGGGLQQLFGIGLDNRVYRAKLDVNGNLALGWLATPPTTFTTLAVASTPTFVGVYGLGTDRQIYYSTFGSPSGTMLSDWRRPAPGTFSSISAAVNAAGRVEVLGTSAVNGAVFGALFDSSNNFLSGFFPAGAGNFRGVLTGL